MADLFINIALPLALAFIMFAMGLGLTAGDFKRVLVQPKDFAVGAVMQIIALPAVAAIFIIAWPTALSPEIQVGIMLLAVCPGGTTSNLLTYMGRGDVALSITLTAVISLVSVFTIPLILGQALDAYMGASAPDLPILKTVIGIFVIVTVPVLLGMTVKRFAPTKAQRIEQGSKHVVTGIFLLTVFAVVYSERANMPGYIAEAGTITLVFNITMLALAFLVALVAGLGKPQRIAVTMECGLQNATLAILIARTMLDNNQIAVPAAIYGLLMLLTAAVVAWFTSRSSGYPAGNSPKAV